METRSPELSWPTAQRTVIGLPDLRRNLRRRERCWVHPLIYIVLPGIQVHTWNSQGITAKTCGGCDGAWHRTRLAILQRQDPVGVPPPQDRVGHSATTAPKVPSMPEWQFI